LSLAAQQSSEELFRGALIAMRLNQDVDHNDGTMSRPEI
jgi:hypothetical protein